MLTEDSLWTVFCKAAVKKKSFELNYNGGTIRREHLDGTGSCEDEATAKFERDKSGFYDPPPLRSSEYFILLTF